MKVALLRDTEIKIGDTVMVNNQWEGKVINGILIDGNRYLYVTDGNNKITAKISLFTKKRITN